MMETTSERTESKEDPLIHKEVGRRELKTKYGDQEQIQVKRTACIRRIWCAAASCFCITIAITASIVAVTLLDNKQTENTGRVTFAPVTFTEPTCGSQAEQEETKAFIKRMGWDEKGIAAKAWKKVRCPEMNDLNTPPNNNEDETQKSRKEKETFHPKKTEWKKTNISVNEIKKFEHPCGSQADNELLRAADQGNLTKVLEMIRCPDLDINTRNEKGMTPLYLASLQGHSEIVGALVHVPGIFINKAIVGSWTPLLAAANGGRAEVIKALLKAPNINVNARKPDWTGFTPLITAGGNLEAVKVLLRCPLVDTEMREHIHGNNAWEMAMRWGNRDVIEAIKNREQLLREGHTC